jgi:hypothetical protein
MWQSLFRRDRPESTSTTQAPAQPSVPFGERMIAELESLRWSARRAGDVLPVAALPLLGEIEDVLFPLATHLIANPPSIDEEIAIEAMVTDYLPTSVNSYVGLSGETATRPRADGRTPGDDLIDQLVVLGAAARELSQAVFAHDADQLATHGRFLGAKFSRSDLDL